jgi:hypothetical protein
MTNPADTYEQALRTQGRAHNKQARKSDIGPEDLKRGLEIIQIAHPEYGVWFISRENPTRFHRDLRGRPTTSRQEGTWEVSRSSRPSDTMAVSESELLQYWRKA